VASTLGTQIPHAVGAAYALKLDAKENPGSAPRIGVAYFGEGAASEGDFHGAMNLASVRDCPMLFMCRNNGFAISTPTEEQYRGDGIASRAAGYGMEAIRVDGTDIFAVYKATLEARKKAIATNRPILLEFMSYRVSHHSTSDDSFTYRKRGDVETWKIRDNPISRLRKWLEAKGLWNDDIDRQARSDIRKAVLTEVATAEREMKPALKNIWNDVYAELSEEQEEQRQDLRRLLSEYPDEYEVDSHVSGLKGL
jgi:2-oxoisovalerate dehydrogenase E1 component alpha subunit